MMSPTGISSTSTGSVNVAFLDDWCSHLEGLVENLDQDLQRAVRYATRLTDDVASLAEKTKVNDHAFFLFFYDDFSEGFSGSLREQGADFFRD